MECTKVEYRRYLSKEPPVSSQTSDDRSNIQLSTERLILREYRLDDRETVHDYARDPDFSQYEYWGPNSVEDTTKFLRDADAKRLKQPRVNYELAVCLKETGDQIGGCGISLAAESSRVAGIGWAIHPKCQKRGFATEAAAALIDFGCRAFGLVLVYATCDTRNVASFRVMEKLGMLRVGRLVGDRQLGDQTFDSFRYEIVLAGTR